MSRDTGIHHGARPALDGGVEFTLWSPYSRSVDVVWDVDGSTRSAAMHRSDDDVLRAHIEETGPGTAYWFRIDGDDLLPDPASRYQPSGISGPSQVVDTAAYPWSDGNWRGIERADLVIYELHVGTMTPAGTFNALIDTLPRLVDLGITAIELMPVAQFPGHRNWGYDGVFPYAVHNTYGGPDGLHRLVNAAHGHGLAIVLDVVYNHLGPEGNVLRRYGPYFTDTYCTPWGDAINMDGPDSDEVRGYFIQNALYWLKDFHIDGLRLDAVHAIVDRSPQPFLADLATAVRSLETEQGRHLHLIAESDANDPRLLRDAAHGGQGLDAVWNDDFHHAVHARLTGERDGYYVDYGQVTDIVSAFRDRFVFAGRRSLFRRRRHGAPAVDLTTDRFVVALQNHDQVGNRARGERLSALLEPNSQRLAAALLLLSPFVPLVFMGEEYGETRPFLYFVDHNDEALLDAVRRGRAEEFADFHCGGDIADPADEATFIASRPDPGISTTPGHAERLELYRGLLSLRASRRTLRPGDASINVHTVPGMDESFSVTYRYGTLLDAAVFNLGDVGQCIEIETIVGRPLRLMLHTEEARFGGDEDTCRMDQGVLILPPLSAAVLTGAST